jgi:hypothetical protein
MKFSRKLMMAAVLLAGAPLWAQEQQPSESNSPEGESWTKALADRAKRGTLHDAFQRVRGDSGKWNDDPQLQHAPPLTRKPTKLSLDDWADQLHETRLRPLSSNDENWILFKTRQLDDNDRVWVERIERNGNEFTIVLNEAIWQGRYGKTFTYYNVFAVNLGKLAPGKYQAKWIIQPLVFRQFEGAGRPIDERRIENWSKDELPAETKATELSVAFQVADEP